MKSKMRHLETPHPAAPTRVLPAWLLAMACGLVGANAQLNPAAVRQLNNDVANDAVSAVEVFSAANTIATGNFEYDNAGPNDVRFKTYKLPFTHGFSSATNEFCFFLEGYLGYFNLTQDVNSFGPPPGEIQVQSLTTTGGGGLTWRLNEWLSVTPRLLFAYSHVWQHFDRPAPPGDPFANVLPDWNADALTLLPSLEVSAARAFGRWDFSLNSRYTYIRVLGLHDSSAFIDLDSRSHVWRNELVASYRSPWKVFDLALRPFGVFARHDLAGQIRHSDFVEHFYEVRLGLGIATPQWLKPVSEASMSFAYYFQGPFTGYSVGLDLAF